MIKRIILEGTKKEVKIIGAENLTLAGIKALNVLNANEILEEIEANGEIEVSENGEYIELNGYEYRYFDSYDEAEAAAIEWNIEVLKDCGLNDNLINIAEINGFIKADWFEEYWTESNERLVYDEYIEYIATEEQLEQLEEGETTEEEIRENYFISLQESIKGQEMDEYKFNFGEEEFQRVLISENLIDLEELAKYCVDVDGVAHALASYDGEEIEHEGMYLYRVN